MKSSHVLVLLVAASALGILPPTQASAQESGNLTGRWVLNRDQSQLSHEVGFNPDWLMAGRTGRGGESGGGGGRGRRGSSGGDPGGYSAPRESEDDAKRLQQLSTEAKTPPAHLTIVDTRGTVTITNARDVSRTYHTDGSEDQLQVEGVPISAVTVRETGGIVIRYKVEQGRELRYTYKRDPAASRLLVDIQFIERGGAGDTVRRVYDLIGPDDPFPPDTTSSDTAAPATGASVPAVPPPPGLRGATPPANAPAPEPFNQQPDAELKGLTRLGVVVEDMGAQAAACGLTQAALQSAVTAKLKSAGFTVLTNTDEDSYVYVNVMTGSGGTGMCVSRYDLSFVTHTTARLSYQTTPVLVQVELLHKGGITGSATAAHGATVQRAVLGYLDEFITRIQAAGK